MPLDPAIALGGATRAPAQQDPLAGIASLMQLVHAFQASKTERLKADQLEQTLPLDLAAKVLANKQAQMFSDALAKYNEGGSANTQGAPSLGVGGISTPTGQENLFTGASVPNSGATQSGGDDYSRRLGLASLIAPYKPDASRAINDSIKTQYTEKMREAYQLGFRPGTPQWNNYLTRVASQGGIFTQGPDGNLVLEPNYAASQGAVKLAEKTAENSMELSKVWAKGPDGQRREFQIQKSLVPQFMQQQAAQNGQAGLVEPPQPTPQTAPQPAASNGPSSVPPAIVPGTLMDSNGRVTSPLTSERAVRQFVGSVPQPPATAPGNTTAQNAEILFRNQPGLNLGAGAPTKAETEFSTKRAEEQAKLISTYRTEADAARQSKNDLGMMRQQIEGGAMGGRLAPGMQAAGEFMMGINAPLPDDVKESLRSGQNFRKAAEAAALSQVKSFVGGSQISDADRKAVEFIQPRLQDDPKARVQWMNYLESRADDKLRVHRKAEEYAARNGNLNGFDAGAIMNAPRTRLIDPVTVFLPNGTVAKMPTPQAAKAFMERVNKMEGLD